MALATELSTPTYGHAISPRWSPKGDYLAWLVDQAENRLLYTVKMSNGNPTGAPVLVQAPGWSSSFNIYTFYNAPLWYSYRDQMLILFFQFAGTSSIQRIYAYPQTGQAPTEFLLSTQVSGDITSPAINNQGTLVAFTTGTGKLGIFDFKANKVSIQSGFSAGMIRNPDFCDDGKPIVYSKVSGANEAIYSQVIGAAQEQKLAEAGTHPKCQSDQVAYYEPGQEGWDLAVVAIDGVKRKTVLENVRFHGRSFPEFTPDGKGLLGVVDKGRGDELVVVEIESGNRKRMHFGEVGIEEPDLVVAGGRTLLAFSALPLNRADWRSIFTYDVTGKF
jgi:Tol biopolymer transport system component